MALIWKCSTGEFTLWSADLEFVMWPHWNHLLNTFSNMTEVGGR